MKFEVVAFWAIIFVRGSQKNHFGTSKMRKWSFCTLKLERPFSTTVLLEKMHQSTKYGRIILKNDIDIHGPPPIHFDRKPWIFIHDRHVVKQAFKKLSKFNYFINFLVPNTYTRTTCERIALFWASIIFIDFFKNKVKFITKAIRTNKFNQSNISLVIR